MAQGGIKKMKAGRQTVDGMGNESETRLHIFQDRE